MRKFVCPHCAKAVTVVETSVGKPVRCPFCEKQFMAGAPPAQKQDDAWAVERTQSPEWQSTYGKPGRRRIGLLMLVSSLVLVAIVAIILAVTTPRKWDELYELAPPDAMGVVLVDMNAIRTSSLGRSVTEKLKDQLPEMPAATDKIRSMAAFMIPPGGRDEPSMCGVVRCEGATKEELSKMFESAGPKSEVAGYETYGKDVLFAIVDANTALMGSSPASLERMIRIHEGKAEAGAPGDLKKLASALEGTAVKFAMVVPDELRKNAGRGPRPGPFPAMDKVEGFALGINLNSNVEVKALLRMGESSDARQAAKDARKAVDDMKEQLAQAAQSGQPFPPIPMKGLVKEIADNLKIDDDGADVVIELALTGKALEEAIDPFLAALGAARQAAQKAKDKSNLHNIGIATRSWQTDHSGEWPPNLKALLDGEYLDEPGVFVAAADGNPPVKDGLPCSYEFIGPLPSRRLDPGVIIAYTRRGVFPAGRNLLHLDCSVQWATEQELADPKGPARTSLRSNYEAVLKAYAADLSEEQKARLKKFYEIE